MKRKRLTTCGIGAATILCALLLFGGMGTAFATDAGAAPGGSSGASAGDSSAGDSGGGDIVLTGFSLQNGDGSEFTGKLTKDNHVRLILNLTDGRVEAGYIPNIRLDTASFTLPGQSSIVCSPKILTSSGKYKLTFNNLTYTGNGTTFSCKIFYTKKNANKKIVNTGLAIESVGMEINQAVTSSDDAATTTKGTGFVLKSASYGQESIYAGQDFTLSAAILATNGDGNVENVTVAVNPPKEISLLNGSSIQYIGTVAPGQTIPASFALKPIATIDEGSYDVSLDVKGVNAKSGEDVAAQMTITVPVLQPERFEIFNAQTPPNLTVGLDDGSGFAEFMLVNQGQGSVNNVSAEIKGDGLSSQEGKQYIGNIAGGEQKAVDFTLLADKAGQLNGQAVISYENARGEVKELTFDFTVDAAEGMSDQGGGMMPPDFGSGGSSYDPGASGGLPPWLIPAGIIAACAIAAVIIVRHIRKKRAAAAEDQLDDDFSDSEDEENR